MPEFEYAVIIPAWNEAEFIPLCIASVQSAMAGIEQSGQLIVVDNNSTDNTAQLATDAGAHVVFEPINQISRARNAGAAVADASIYIFIDADSQVSVALLRAAIEAIQQHDIVGGGANITADQSIRQPARMGFTCWNWISRQFKLAAGCFVYCRADAFEAVGGFTLERYAGEELALSRALRRWGRGRGLIFHIIAEHTITTSVRKMDWYTPGQLIRQVLVAMLPGALNSKRFMSSWYDESIQRSRKDD